MQPPWGVTEKRGFLLEVNVDSTKENWLAIALILPVHPNRQVKREHRRLVTQLAQCGDKRVVVETVSTKHVAGARRELNDVQASREWRIVNSE
jgi:hypothetical protein